MQGNGLATDMMHVMAPQAISPRAVQVEPCRESTWTAELPREADSLCFLSATRASTRQRCTRRLPNTLPSQDRRGWSLSSWRMLSAGEQAVQTCRPDPMVKANEGLIYTTVFVLTLCTVRECAEGAGS